MDVIYTNLSLDFNENYTLKSVKVKQHDNGGRKLRITLFNNGTLVPLNAGTDVATMNASVDGTVTVYNMECTITSNKVVVDISRELTTLSGIERCEVKITSADHSVHTATFNMIVEPSVTNTDSPSVLKTTELAEVLTEIETKMTELESEQGNILGQFENIEENIDDNASQIADLTTSVNLHSSQIADLTNDVWEINTMLSSLEESVETAVENAKQDIISDLSTAISSAKNDVTSEITSLKEEFREKYEILFDEMINSKKELLRAFERLSDEVDVGNGSIAGQAIIIGQGTITQSIAGEDTRGED